MHIRSFVGYDDGDIQHAIDQAEAEADRLLTSMHLHELISVQAQSISDSNGYIHIITIVYK